MTESNLKNRKKEKKDTEQGEKKATEKKVQEKKEEKKVVEVKNQKCEKSCCTSSIVMCILVVIMGCLAYYQCVQINNAKSLLEDLKNDRKNMCANYEHKAHAEKQHFAQSDLLRYFAVTFEGGLSYESEELKEFLATKDITQEERYKNEEEEMKRRESLYGPYIENGFEHDDRFYIKLSSPEVGYGLFAKTDIPAGSVIGVYGGRLTRVLPNGATDTDYAWSYQNYEDPKTGETFEICIDGRVYGTWLRFVNHKHDSEANLYGMYVPYKNNWYLMYHARNFIAKDEELFTSYGDFYWEARKVTHPFESHPEYQY
jgi:hypothetical protein